MIQHVNHPGPDQMEGPTPSSNTSENVCQKGNCYHWVSSAEPSLPWKLLPQTLENPLGGRDQNMRQWGEPCLKVRNWGSFPVLRGLGQGIKFPFASIFSYTSCTKEFNYRVVVRSDNTSGRASKVKRWRCTKENRPRGLDVIISDTG